MRLVFTFNDGQRVWSDIWSIDRYGNLRGVLGSQQTNENYKPSPRTAEMIRDMAHQYFRAVRENHPGFQAKVFWDPCQCPWEVAGFLQSQEAYALKHPDYKPRAADQPRRH